jgi:hypothetical protein
MKIYENMRYHHVPSYNKTTHALYVLHTQQASLAVFPKFLAPLP